MKNDRYLKIVLTIIAICLVWICIRDIEIGQRNLFASGNSSGQQEVYVTGGELDVCIRGIDESPYKRWEALPVEVQNWPSSFANLQSIREKETKKSD